MNGYSPLRELSESFCVYGKFDYGTGSLNGRWEVNGGFVHTHPHTHSHAFSLKASTSLPHWKLNGGTHMKLVFGMSLLFGIDHDVL